MNTRRSAIASLLVLVGLSGCGDRDKIWTTTVTDDPASLVELRDAVVWLDSSANRALVVHADADQKLAMSAIPLGHRVISSTPSPDGSKLFVLSQGDPVRLTANDELPALTVIDPTAGTQVR